MKNTPKRAATPAKEKREWFMSMDRDERNLLQTLGLRERALYCELKWLASFQTGAVQYFGKRVITFQYLADLITVPTTQGRAADTMNAKEACRVLMRLHDAGLVGEIENHPIKGMRFALPMSPIFKEAALALRQQAAIQEVSEQEKLPKNAQFAPEKLPNDAPVDLPENPIATRVCEPLPLSLSVLTISKGDQYDFHTDISNLAAVHGTANFPARDAVAGGNLEIDSASRADESRGATANGLTVDAIKDRLRRSQAGFSWIDQAESGAMYGRWIAANHSAQRFEEAVAAVEADFSIEPTPRAVDSELRGGGQYRREAMMRAEQQARRRRGVAL
ncbi:MAG: hypothetical protein KA740_02155 [Rhodoferax sp.]|nr:hypothetical protein [Rhodoferax sp.]